uniref:Uncharacterized protein n=1 Tax=Oryza brachyantha TaxID=4533 RepID=J3M4K0_ORYBR
MQRVALAPILSIHLHPMAIARSSVFFSLITFSPFMLCYEYMTYPSFNFLFEINGGKLQH